MNQSAHIVQTDSEVIKLYLQTHDQVYFGILYRRYSAKVFAKCRTLLGEEEAARDAMQDIFMKIMLSLAAFSERSQFSTWVYSITYNYCIDQIRKRKKGQTIFSSDADNAPDIAEEVADDWLLDMELKYLRLVMNALPLGDKAILMMKYHHEMSIKEIAEAIDKSESAVKMKILRAKEKAFGLFKEFSAKDI